MKLLLYSSSNPLSNCSWLIVFVFGDSAPIHELDLVESILGFTGIYIWYQSNIGSRFRFLIKKKFWVFFGSRSLSSWIFFLFWKLISLGFLEIKIRQYKVLTWIDSLIRFWILDIFLFGRLVFFLYFRFCTLLLCG